MQIERLSIALRPRNAWEAIDLGVRLAIHHRRALYASWLVCCVPVAVLVFLVVGHWLASPVAAWLILWWLKPLFDRVALHVLSHAVFGESPSVRATLASLPGLLRRPGLIGMLTWRRFSTLRGLMLPVDMLEGLRSRAARERRRLIGRRVAGAMSWLTVGWVHLIYILWMGALGLALMMVPIDAVIDFEHLWDLFSKDSLQWLLSLSTWLYVAADILLEPLYVAGGFSLYLKRRNDLEAWDVELQFRRIAQQHAERHALGHASGVLGMLACLGLALMLACTSPASHAQEPRAETADAEAPAPASEGDTQRQEAFERAPEALDEVLDRPEFGRLEHDRRLRWRTQPSKPTEPPKGWLGELFASFAELMVAIGKLIASLGRILAWGAIALVTLGLLYLILRNLHGWQGRSARQAPPAELAGFDIRPQSLPDDVASAALALLQAGDARAALSLLFRASLSALAHRDGVPFVRGDTEGDCLLRVREHAPQRSAFFMRLMLAWQQLAYANRPLTPDAVAGLCTDWGQQFGSKERP